MRRDVIAAAITAVFADPGFDPNNKLAGLHDFSREKPVLGSSFVDRVSSRLLKCTMKRSAIGGMVAGRDASLSVARRHHAEIDDFPVTAVGIGP
jgi:hypothetical protein